MEALLKPVSSTFCLQQYSFHERGYLIRDSLSLTTRRMPVSYLHVIHRKWNVKQSFELSALADSNEGYVDEKPPNEKEIVENYKLPSKHDQDGYAILLKKLKTFYCFCRPYNLLGIELSILSISLLPISSIADLSPTFYMGLLQALALGALNHIYVMTINQLSDVEIDKVNKQYLPLISGEFSSGDIVVISLSAVMLSIGIVFMSKSPALLCALVASLLYGTGYSAQLPFLRWKRHPLLAIPSTVLCCAFGVHIPYFIHIQKYVLGRPNLLTKSIIFQTTMMCLYCTSGLILKDIPDTDGDRENGIVTLSIQFGEERACTIGVIILLFAQLGLGMVVGISSSLWFGKLIAVMGHLALALVLWNRSRQVDPTNKSSAQSFHMFLWKLIGIECLLTQFVR